MKLSANKKIQGFTLVEVLVAMVIFAIGMLGIAGMQGIALKDNNDAYMRSQAVFFAYDMGDRIRANPDYWDTTIIQLPGGAGTLAADKIIVEAFGVYPFCSTDDPPVSAVGTDPDPAVDCVNAQQLAQYDWYRIRQDITGALPPPAAPRELLTISKIVDPDVAGQFLIRVVISWGLTETKDNNKVNSILPSFTYDIRP